MESTNYQLTMKARLDTSEVNSSLARLNQTGGKTTRELEVAVKRLDNAVQDLTRTWEKQAQAAERASHAAERAAQTQSISTPSGDVEGGSLTQFANMAVGQMGARQLRAISKLIAKAGYGDTEVGKVATGGLDWAATAMVATRGNPLATLGGGLIGAVDAAMRELVASAERASAELQHLAEIQSEQIHAWRNAQNELKLKNVLKGMPEKSEDALRRYIDTAAQSRAKYEEFVTPDSKSSKSFAANYIGLDFVGDRDKKMKQLAQTMKRDEVVAAAAEAELNSRKKQKEREQKEEERRGEYATRQGQRFAQKMELESFNEGLQGMSIAELQDTVSALRGSRTAIKGSLAAAWGKAQTTKTSQDIQSAEKMEDEFDMVSAKLKDAESVMNTMMKLGTNATNKDTPLGQLLSTPISDEAAKGYDVGGYASVEDAIWKSQLDAQKKIEQNTQGATKSLEKIADKVELIQTNMQENTSEASWGG